MAGQTRGKTPEPIATSVAELRLRPLVPSPTDWRLVAGWLSDPRVLEWYEGRDRPHDYEMVAVKWSDERIAAEQLDCRIIEYGRTPIGYIQCYPVDDAASYELESAEDTWGIDLFIGDPEYWSQGLGTAVVRGVVDHLLSGGACRVVIDPRLENARAIRSYEKAGFRKVKVLRAHEEHEGAMRDCWLMEAVAEA